MYESPAQGKIPFFSKKKKNNEDTDKCRRKECIVIKNQPQGNQEQTDDAADPGWSHRHLEYLIEEIKICEKFKYCFYKRNK